MVNTYLHKVQYRKCVDCVSYRKPLGVCLGICPLYLHGVQDGKGNAYHPCKLAAAGVSMLSDVNWNRRNMVIFAIALSVGLGLQQEPDALKYVEGTLKILLTSGLLPAALIAIVLNLILPEELSDEATEEISGGMAGHGEGSLAKDDHV